MLPADLFLRTHRQYIVQTRLIEEIHPADGIVKLPGISIPFSRENKVKIEALLQ
jgi:DNA-binding LytR/AlgR family response regulator